jgi:hypothetical protein
MRRRTTEKHQEGPITAKMLALSLQPPLRLWRRVAVKREAKTKAQAEEAEEIPSATPRGNAEVSKKTFC